MIASAYPRKLDITNAPVVWGKAGQGMNPKAYQPKQNEGSGYSFEFGVDSYLTLVLQT